MAGACPGTAGARVSSGIAGFKVARELGSGRFSQTWMVRDEGKGQLVLKLLRRYAKDPATVQRFITEADRLGAAGTRHRSLARPVAAGVHLVSAFFLVYEYGGEATLADELRLRGRLAPARALELCAQICDGLAVLHQQGVWHLDLKPANVGLSYGPNGEERAVVLDGYTRHLLDHAGLNRDEGPLPLSSAAYAAPDAVRDARSDLYSVGALLFQLLSGRLPVVGATAPELTFAHARHRALRLEDVRHLAPAPLEQLLATLLSKVPAQRPSTAAELAASLRALLPLAVSEPPPPALDTPPEVRAQRARRSGRPGKLAAVVLASACAAVALLSFAVRGRAVLTTPAVAQAGVAPSAAAEGNLPAQAAAAEPSPPGAAPQDLQSKGAADLEHGPLRYAKTFERAQKALWTNRPAQAVAILQPLLAMPLSRRERAKAEHMMGDARARQGNKAAAASWYTRSLQLSQR
jgi:serine/threonine-protein kinase